ncbi:efflux RND transporter permease subunit [Achromobacter xylosoxidans]|uniref:efflux RND transporter permease subunit n=1 Tax=Alcaligenes xylosoxydans xylosoxydans TaxID=85698 RepID=UPI00244A2771|nr:efflux RND transporter permease subunit [Achromobacter xylosoxidans]MDH0521334.1 multidrug efflux RND transporter permease subunit [Achromobacter xylosoxidans]MDH0544998.1 multidrug efflux RND transporter permease subunit [Achromobacter xylosoxidans]
MPNFFIQRPNFALVIAIFIALAGLLAISSLPVAQYPSVAPPQVIVRAVYPGASAGTINDSVTSLIEEELNGAKGLLYYESQSNGSGVAEITVTFEPGTDPDLAQVDVQNRIKRVESRLPQSVMKEGLQLEQASSSFLLIYALTYKEEGKDQVGLADYAARNINNEIRRVPGVGRVQMFAAERALRIWIDPAKLVGYGLSVDDVNRAIAAQNVQVSGGATGDQPSPSSQEITATINVRGQFSTIEEFAGIVLRANADGSTVRLGDVARLEMGRQDYRMGSRLNGQPAAAMGVQLAPGANALETAKGIKARLAELSGNFPSDISYSVPFDTSVFVDVAIKKVVMTLAEAVVLVFLVMLLFLQNFRYTLIPTIVVPICLLGTLAVMLPLGFSVNMMTMFGMVLAIGILVDDAIVVVENVERLMAEGGLSPRDATVKAMGQISGAIVGITLVLAAVFLPLAFMTGSVGVIYRQFSVSLAVSILFSGFLALTLTPALSVLLLKPVAQGHHEKKGFFGWFNRVFARMTERYTATTARLLARTGRVMLVYAVLVGALGYAYTVLPSAFLPTEDQGYMNTDVQLPPGATLSRTLETTRQLEQYLGTRPAVADVLALQGFSFSGQGQNAGLGFVMFKDWARRAGSESAMAEADRANQALAGVPDGVLFSAVPPPVEGMGNATGFSLRLQDRAGLGREALLAATETLIRKVYEAPQTFSYIMVEGLSDAPELDVRIDRDKAEALGVPFDAINSALSTAFGSALVNEFPNHGRMQRVIVQAEPESRATPESVARLNVMNRSGELVPLESFSEIGWKHGPVQLIRYNGYPSIKLNGDAAYGSSTGQAMKEIERLVGQLPHGIGFEWTGLSYQEKAAGSQAPMLLALALLVVFLVLVALYESWKIPASVLLIVPVGALGAVAAVIVAGMPNDVYFKVGLVTIIGLAAKNAILIIEFAKDLHAQGRTLREAAIEAARLRFRPIVMTSVAFILGVVPLVIATGAGATSQRAIGTGVLGGMLSATILGVLFVPVFFVWTLSLLERRKTQAASRPLAPIQEGEK